MFNKICMLCCYVIAPGHLAPASSVTYVPVFSSNKLPSDLCFFFSNKLPSDL